MTAEATEGGDSIGVRPNKVRHPFVVSVIDGSGNLNILEPGPRESATAYAQNAVHHLGVYSVDVLVFDAQLRVRGMVDAFLQAVKEAHLSHAVKMVRLTGYVGCEILRQISSDTGAAHILSLDFPCLAAVFLVGHIWHFVLQVCRGVVCEEVTRKPGNVQMRVCRYHFVIHLFLPLSVLCLVSHINAG